MGAEFQCRSQFKVHGADQVVLCQEQQSLPVDFLGAKRFGYILPTWREERTVSSYLCVTTFKGARCSFREDILIRRETQFHAVLRCLYVADPATFLASNSVLGTLFSSENSYG